MKLSNSLGKRDYQLITTKPTSPQLQFSYNGKTEYLCMIKGDISNQYLKINYNNTLYSAVDLIPGTVILDVDGSNGSVNNYYGEVINNYPIISGWYTIEITSAGGGGLFFW